MTAPLSQDEEIRAENTAEVWHWYRSQPAQIGDQALCGHVKDRETTDQHREQPTCPLCRLKMGMS